MSKKTKQTTDHGSSSHSDDVVVDSDLPVKELFRNAECPLCLETYLPPNVKEEEGHSSSSSLLVLKCGHIYHRSCFHRHSGRTAADGDEQDEGGNENDDDEDDSSPLNPHRHPTCFLCAASNNSTNDNDDSHGREDFNIKNSAVPALSLESPTEWYHFEEQEKLVKGSRSIPRAERVFRKRKFYQRQIESEISHLEVDIQEIHHFRTVEAQALLLEACEDASSSGGNISAILSCLREEEEELLGPRAEEVEEDGEKSEGVNVASSLAFKKAVEASLFKRMELASSSETLTQEIKGLVDEQQRTRHKLMTLRSSTRKILSAAGSSADLKGDKTGVVAGGGGNIRFENDQSDDTPRTRGKRGREDTTDTTDAGCAKSQRKSATTGPAASPLSILAPQQQRRRVSMVINEDEGDAEEEILELCTHKGDVKDPSFLVSATVNVNGCLHVQDDQKEEDDDLLFLFEVSPPRRGGRRTTTATVAKRNTRTTVDDVDDDDIVTILRSKKKEVAAEDDDVEDSGLILAGTAPPPPRVCEACGSKFQPPGSPWNIAGRSRGGRSSSAHQPLTILPSIPFFTFSSCPFNHEVCWNCALTAVAKGLWLDGGCTSDAEVHWVKCPTCQERISSSDLETLVANNNAMLLHSSLAGTGDASDDGERSHSSGAELYVQLLQKLDWPQDPTRATNMILPCIETYREKELSEVLSTMAKCPSPACGGLVDVQDALEVARSGGSRAARRETTEAEGGVDQAEEAEELSLGSAWIHACCPHCQEPFCYIELSSSSQSPHQLQGDATTTPSSSSSLVDVRCATTIQTAVIDLVVTFAKAASTSSRWNLIFNPFPPLEDLTIAASASGGGDFGSFVTRSFAYLCGAGMSNNVGGLLGLFYQKLFSAIQSNVARLGSRSPAQLLLRSSRGGDRRTTKRSYSTAGAALKPDQVDSSSLEAVKEILGSLPDMKALLPTDKSRVFDARRKIEQEGGAKGYNMFAWCLLSHGSSVALVPKNLQLAFLGTPHQFILQTATPAAEKEFQRLKASVGGGRSSFAFHGSRLENWHSILHNGLKNASGSSLQTTGAAYGNGIYLSPHANLALQYSGFKEEDKSSSNRSSSNNWSSHNPHHHQHLSQDFNCVAIVENIDSHDMTKTDYNASWVAPGTRVWVQPNESHVVTRFLLLYQGNQVPSNVFQLDLSQQHVIDHLRDLVTQLSSSSSSFSS